MKGEKPVEIPAEKARAGVISGRVVIVLAISMLLALIAMIAVLSFVYTEYSPWRSLL